jgi:aryl-alcohol dehydrogenase-like predicted oxidoreductase
VNYKRLGKSNRRVSEIGFGGWAIGGDQFEAAYGPSNDETSLLAIQRALELGITFFDTADLFGRGHSEALIGRVLSEWPDRDRITVATKGGVNFYRGAEAPEVDLTPYGIANAVEQSRIRLRLDCIDLYMLMNPPLDLLLQNGRVWETLAALRRAGKIASYGVSLTDADDGVRILKEGILVDALEVTYNMFFQSAAIELLPLAKKKRVAIIAREPLANGFLAKAANKRTYGPTDHRSWALPEYLEELGSMFEKLHFLETPERSTAQAALRFVLDHPAVTVAIPGIRTAEQAEENCAASSLPPLSECELKQINDVFFPEVIP